MSQDEGALFGSCPLNALDVTCQAAGNVFRREILAEKILGTVNLAILDRFFVAHRGEHDDVGVGIGFLEACLTSSTMGHIEVFS